MPGGEMPENKGEKPTKRTDSKSKPREKARHGAWIEPFLKALEANGGHVGKACKSANVNRSTAYTRRKRDEEFAQAWDDLIEYGIDSIEETAQRLARDGVEEEVYDKEGKLSGTKIRHFPTLQIFFLRNRRPEQYNKRVGYGEGTVITAEDQAAAMGIAAMVVEGVAQMLGSVPVWTAEDEPDEGEAGSDE